MTHVQARTASESSRETLMDRVLGYEHPEFLRRLQHKLDLTPEQAEEMFSDLKKFLYLCGTAKVTYGMVPSKPIDNAWHEFIIYTRDYIAFCKQFFGEYIHHIPKNYAIGDPDGRAYAANTYVLAEKTFGQLSLNWGASAEDAAGGEKDCSRGVNGLKDSEEDHKN